MWFGIFRFQFISFRAHIERRRWRVCEKNSWDTCVVGDILFWMPSTVREGTDRFRHCSTVPFTRKTKTYATGDGEHTQNALCKREQYRRPHSKCNSVICVHARLVSSLLVAIQSLENWTMSVMWCDAIRLSLTLFANLLIFPKRKDRLLERLHRRKDTYYYYLLCVYNT